MNRCLWSKVESAPVNTPVEVCGDSGHNTHHWFVTNAYLDEEGRWWDVTGTLLSEAGWTPYVLASAISFSEERPSNVRRFM